MRFLPIVCLSALIPLAPGCRKQEIYPVEGKIVFADGRPAGELQGGFIVFDCSDRKASARGVIDQDGSFRLSTNGNDDGAYLGKHRVQIGIPRSVSEAGRPRVVTMDPRFTRFDTSGLEAEVEPKRNEITLTVERRQR